MATKYIERATGAAASHTGSHAGVGVDSDDNRFYVNANGTRVPMMEAAGASSVATLVTTKSVLPDESGKTFFLHLAGGFAVTLPAPVAGLRYKFIVKTAPTTAYTIATADSANIIVGGVNELEVDTGDDGPSSSTGDLITFVANTALAGDYVDLISDGTSWFLSGQTRADGGITIGTT
jgi:hypothetical protein